MGKIERMMIWNKTKRANASNILYAKNNLFLKTAPPILLSEK
jgi:hypothetical protein